MSTEEGKLGVALLGSGIFASEQQLPAILSCDKLQLKAIYARTHASAMKLAKASGTADSAAIYCSESNEHDLEALLRRDDISAVIIVLPITVQPSIIKACLGAGKHVLSEKPIAPTIAAARELLAFSQRPVTPAFLMTSASQPHPSPPPLWGVAENYRFQPLWTYAAERIAALGSVRWFAVQVASLMEEENKYYNTAWRRAPAYQGGFVLDGGVHYIAGLRTLLAGDEVERVASFSACNIERLRPVDTVNAVLRTKSGKVGSFALSYSSPEKKFEYTIACERGVVVVGGGGTVIVRDQDGKEERNEFPINSGVKGEVAAFAEGLLKGAIDPLQTPEEALKDLEIIEKMLSSGEKEGESMEITGGME